MGNTAIVEAPIISNQTFIGLVPKRDLESRYLFYLMSSMRDELQAKAAGAIQQYLSRDDFRSLRIPLPSPPVQRAIADFLDAESARIDALIAKKLEMLDRLDLKLSALVERRIRGLAAEYGEVRLKYAVGTITVGIVVTPSIWYSDDGVPALRGINVKPHRLILDDLVHLTAEGHQLHKKSELCAGDVVVVRTGQAGVAAIVPGELDGANCVDLLVVRPGVTDSGYLAYVLNSDWTQKHVARYSVGTIQSHFNVAALRELPIPVPPRQVQEEVVRELREKSVRLEETQQRLRSQMKLLKEHRQALITAAVTGELEIPGVGE